jgi:hypothetical protein
MLRSTRREVAIHMKIGLSRPYADPGHPVHAVGMGVVATVDDARDAIERTAEILL